jgi:hypothetical protein
MIKLKQITVEKYKLKKCPICNENGIIRIIEILPSDGLYMQTRHPNNIIHEWAQYETIGIHKPKPKPDKVKCPKCNKDGIVYGYRHNLKKPFKITYLVIHEKIANEVWGKGTQLERPKRRKCTIYDKKQRDELLKQLGRYIEYNELIQSS